MTPKQEQVTFDFIGIVIDVPLKALIVWALWNGLVVKLFAAPRLSYWSAMGLYFLVNMFQTSYTQHFIKTRLDKIVFKDEE